MTPHESIIPYGYCHCGCGQKTSIATYTNTARSLTKGRPIRFLPHHHMIEPRPPIHYGYVKNEPVAYIPLTQGYWAIVDRKNLDKVRRAGWPWCYQKGYAARRGNIMLHNIIMPPPLGMETDHRNSNPLDCRESNLRCGTHRQNTLNQKLATINTSGYKGVHWVKANNRWQARIYIDGKRISLGCFPKEQKVEAAQAYDRAAIKHYGKFAKLNFPQDGSSRKSPTSNVP